MGFNRESEDCIKMKFDAILAVRNTGTRLYGKPLQLLDIENGTTILEYLVKYMKKSDSLQDIILAIADSKGNEIFADLAEKNGWKYMFGDEKDVLGRMLDAADEFGTDVILRGSTESPFLYYQGLDELFQAHVAGGYDLSKYSALPEGTGYSLNNTEALRICHKQGEDRHRSELVNSYMFDNQEDFNIQTIKPVDALRRPEVRVTVDYPEDLVFCRQVYQALKEDEKLIEIADIIDFWDKYPQIRKPMEEIGIDWGHGRLWE
jgi:spore coat polysaccharide biosynthesis protein SpsF